MMLKKANAILALLSSFALLVHMGFCAFAYLTFYYNPTLKTLTALPFALLTCAHAVCGMCAVFLLGDGTRLDVYQRQNASTIVQRVSAAFIFPLLIVHLRTFELLSSFSESKAWVPFALLICLQVAFYAIVTAHVATSFSRAFVTLGLLADRKKVRVLDRLAYLVCTAVFLIASVSVVRGELLMFLQK